MVQARDPWWVIGSAAVSLHIGKNIAVQDIDVLLSVEDARKVRRELDIVATPNEPHPLFFSEEYFTWIANPLKVEFMAGFAVFSRGKWEKIMCGTRQLFVVGTQNIYVPEAIEMGLLLNLFGRPKDDERLCLLRQSGFSV